MEVNRGWFEENNIEVGDEIDIEEASGEKDACYSKVKSRYKVWPSAYASGALVKCRKVGAANWGNKTKKEELELDEKCWSGYEKKGMKTMFGKRYPNCVKKEETIEDANGNTFAEVIDLIKPDPIKKVEESVRIPAKTGNIILVTLNWRGKLYMMKLFFPQITKPNRQEVQDQIEKVYPGSRVQSYYVSDIKPGEQFLQVEGAAWTKKSGKSESGGLNEKGRRSYERENPGSDLKAPSRKVYQYLSVDNAELS